jgi:hypothetical protein
VNDRPLRGFEETKDTDPTEAVLCLTDGSIRRLFWTYRWIALSFVLQDGDMVVIISRCMSPSDIGVVAPSAV